jgi:hypothetical protein
VSVTMHSREAIKRQFVHETAENIVNGAVAMKKSAEPRTWRGGHQLYAMRNHLIPC